MNKLIRALLSVTLMLLLLLPLCSAAFAASTAAGPQDLRLKPNTFASNQYYESSADNVPCCTVQVAAGLSAQGAADRANAMVAKGLDAFVYMEDGMYYVMCGKFGSEYEALCYGEMIHMDPAEASAYMTYVSLPEKAISTFLGTFHSAVRVNQNSSVMESYWEEPSGTYLRADAEDTVEVYTVQFSRGTCFTRSESLRDRMERYGYPSFVYKENMIYRTLSGMFLDRNEAKQYCKLLRRNTKETDAVVKSAMVPQSELESFLEWWSEQK